MPKQRQVRRESRARSRRRRLSSPMAALRTSEIKSKPPAATATRPRRRRSRPCKHCAASARKRSYASSLWFLFAEFLEARIVAERIEHGIEPEQRGSERHVFSKRTLARNRE